MHFTHGRFTAPQVSKAGLPPRGGPWKGTPEKGLRLLTGSLARLALVAYAAYSPQGMRGYL